MYCMQLVKSGQIANCCHPNALMTLKEYLEDYACDKTKVLGEKLIECELNKIPDEKIRERAKTYIREEAFGKRDFRF